MNDGTMTGWKRRARWGLFPIACGLLSLLALGCEGSINDPPGTPDNPYIPPDLPPDPEDLLPQFRLEPNAPTTQPGLRRLTKPELVRAILDVTGVNADVSDLPDDPELRNLGIEAGILNISDGAHMRTLLEIATDVAAATDIDATFPCGAAVCNDDELRTFLENAFTEQLDTDEFARYQDIYTLAQADLDPEQSRRAMVQQALFSSKFLYRTEIGGPDGRLTATELAKKLSFFLWGRPPDAELRGLAFDGTLTQASVLQAQTDRLMSHENTRVRIIEIVFDWLGLDHFDLSTKDASADLPVDALQASMIEEAERMIGRVLYDEALGLRELLTTDQTEVDELLAMHYGIEGITGTEFQSASLLGTNRRGLLTTALVLSAHSKESGRSPMQRGNFLVDEILCLGFPAEAGVVTATLPDGVEDLSFREQFAPLETTQPCSNCHVMLNAGFAFALYDNVGRRYPLERVADDEAVGELEVKPYDPVAFTNPPEAMTEFANHPVLTRCFVGQTFRYGQGSVPADLDAELLMGLEESFDGSDGDVLDLVRSIALSERFSTAVSAR